MNATTPSGHAAASPVCTCPSGDGSLRHPCPQHPGARSPDGYAYIYPWPFGPAGETVIRFNGGESVNGSKPIRSVPYWLGTHPAASQTATAWLHAVDGYAGWHEMHTWATAITHATAAAFADGAPARAQALNDALHYILERQTDIIHSELAQCRAAHDAAKRGLEA